MIAASAGLIPYQIYCFNSFSLTSFAANIPVVYLVGILMPLAALGFLPVLHRHGYRNTRPGDGGPVLIDGKNK